MSWVGVYIKYQHMGEKIPVKSTISYVSSFLLLKKHFLPLLFFLEKGSQYFPGA